MTFAGGFRLGLGIAAAGLATVFILFLAFFLLACFSGIRKALRDPKFWWGLEREKAIREAEKTQGFKSGISKRGADAAK